MTSNPTDFTKAERAQIATAYAALQYIADTTECSAPLRLESALKYEKRQRHDITAARALMVAEALAGMVAELDHSPAPAPAELWGISMGLAVAHMFGGYIGRRYVASHGHFDQAAAGRSRDRVRDFIAMAGDCAKAQEARQQRRRAAGQTAFRGEG